MTDKVHVVGVGMTKFEKPGSSSRDYPELASDAGRAALDDATLPYGAIDQVIVGYVYGESAGGQRVAYELGLTGVPIVNVHNTCATGSSALYLARQLVRGGQADCVLAVGFEKMELGSITGHWPDRAGPIDRHLDQMTALRGDDPSVPFAPKMFGFAGREHMERHGTTAAQFAKVAEKNHRHAEANPNSQSRTPHSIDDILASRLVFDPLTKLQCCPTSNGAAAAVVCSDDVVRKNGLASKAVEILGMSMVTDEPSTFDRRSPIALVGAEMTGRAAKAAYNDAGVRPDDVDVIELHDCFSVNELLSYESLGLCPDGRGGELIDSGAVTYGGTWVVNPSGGLIAKGHPLGATGLAQCTELSWQLRGMAGARQVEGAKVALQHNIGLGGAAVVTIYQAP